VPFAKRRDWIASNFPSFRAVRQNDHMIGTRDHRVFHIRVKRVHCRESALKAKTVDTDERYFRVHRVDHLDRCGANDRMLNLANDSTDDRKLNLRVGQQVIRYPNVVGRDVRFQVPRQAFRQCPGGRP